MHGQGDEDISVFYRHCVSTPGRWRCYFIAACHGIDPSEPSATSMYGFNMETSDTSRGRTDRDARWSKYRLPQMIVLGLFTLAAVTRISQNG